MKYVAPVFFLFLTGVFAQPTDETVDRKIRKARYQARVDILNRLLEDVSADRYVGWADGLKAEKRYDEAAVYYLIATKKDPKHIRAAYQLACTFALWGQKKLALEWLARAVQNGFWGASILREEADLDSVRSLPGFDRLSQKVVERYTEEAPKHAPRSVVRVPAGEAPSGGWPVILLLHGWGASHADFVEMADLAAGQGMVGIALDGPTVRYVDSYSWTTEDLGTTHRHLQKVLAAHRDKLPDATGPVYLSGFSQGAHQATLLLAAHPDQYAGTLSWSPGGRLALPRSLSRRGRALYLIAGKRDHPVNVRRVQDTQKLWVSGEWPVRLDWHEGGHRFPKDWESRFTQAMKWVTEQARNSSKEKR
ncbi:MAG: alpha/beta fold hydrolase [Planctomycetota bacterium]|jgi:predicted esterase|nr:alpha/beta fold hydrolase [Planctomycetota bacterium]